LPDTRNSGRRIKRKKQDSSRNLLSRAYERFVRIRGRSREIALGFALGIFIGMSPTMGIQMPIAVFFAALLKWSKISAVFGVWITNPFTSPFIYGLTYLVGARVLGLEAIIELPDELTWSTVKELLKNAPVLMGALTVGGIIVGLPLAFLSYFFSYAAVNRYQEGIKAKVAAQKERLANTKEKVKKRIHKKTRPE
jgi:uncharacterized protein (DUF2062 family)